MINSSQNKSFETAVITTSGIDVNISSMFDLDRYTGDSLDLPYTFDEVRVKSNELCVHDNVNASLAKLHHNFLYLNAQTKIADNNFPKKYTGFMASTSATSFSGVGWYDNAKTSAYVASQLADHAVPATTSTLLSGIVAGDFTRTDYSVDTYVGIVALSSTLIAIQSNVGDTQASIPFNVATVEDASGLQFTNIRSVKFQSDHKVIILDNALVHKLDIDPVLTGNRALSGVGRFLINTIGGKSKDIYDKDKFNIPIDVCIGNDDDVYILDQADYGIKKYDKDLNWLQTSSRRNHFTSLSGGKVVGLTVDKETDHVYVISDNGILFEYDNRLSFVQQTTFVDPRDTGETYNKIEFSNTNSDVIYVMTNKSLYKKFKTKLATSIGAFRLSENNISEDDVFAFLSIMTTTKKQYDHVFIGSNNTSHAAITVPLGKIYKFDETIDYKTIINDLYKSDLLPLSSVYIKGSEYVTDITINKAISKLLYNHLIFRDSFLLKYVAAYDKKGRLQLTNVDHLKPEHDNLFSYEVTQDHYIGINEPVFAENINRLFKKIYDLQSKFLLMCAETVTNKFPYASQCIELK
tara:strand:- start:1080 stop:2813 length:1734 start_codon:yes stop_codon:yes gene_type:complete